MGVVSAATVIMIGVPRGFAATGDELRPNLVPLPASNVGISVEGGQRLLSFSTTTKNVGTGAVELRGGQVAGDKQHVFQRVFLEGGGHTDYTAGDFVYHPEHAHIHFEGYATYELQPENAPGASQRTGQKTTFCVMDTTRIDTKLPGAPKTARYTLCDTQVQGMSVGWGDTYGYRLAGQSIDVTGLPDGTYRLRIIVDPNTRLIESNDADNISEVRVQLSGTTVTVLDGAPKPGRPR